MTSKANWAVLLARDGAGASVGMSAGGALGAGRGWVTPWYWWSCGSGLSPLCGRITCSTGFPSPLRVTATACSSLSETACEGTAAVGGAAMA